MPTPIPQPVLESVERVWSQAEAIAPQHVAQIQQIANGLLVELEAKMRTLAGRSPGSFTTVHTASKLLQLQALAERLGYDFGQDMGKELAAMGTFCAGLGRTWVADQLAAWAPYAPSLKLNVNARLASDLLTPGLLERYAVSRRTYGMDAIKAMREEMVAGAALQGETLAATWARVQRRVQIPTWKAERIVRTEHSYAINARALADMQERYPGDEAEQWLKQLVAIHDTRTGDDSKYVDGQQRSLNAPFDDNEGRVYMHPPNRPNDREVVIFVPAQLPPIEELRRRHAERQAEKQRAAEAAAEAERLRKEQEERDKVAEAERLRQAEEDARKKAEEDAKARRLANPFPDDPSSLRVVQQLGGSTGAELVEDEFGRRFVRKSGASPDHLREEFAADEAYRALGANVPRGRLYDDGTKPIKLTEFVDGGVPLSSVLKPDGSPIGKLGKQALADLRKHFAADAVLGSWDVVGLNLDNVLVTPDGKAWRIDNGGSLRYRAMGTPKGGAFREWPMELWSLRKKGAGPANPAQDVFGPLGMGDLAKQVRAMDKRKAELDKVLRQHDPTLADLVAKRLENASKVTSQGAAMLKDGWTDAWADDFGKHWLQLDQGGVVNAMPAALKPKAKKVTIDGKQVAVKDQANIKDDKGKEWDDLRQRNRGDGAMPDKIGAYLAAHGLDMDQVERWASAQGGSSWSGESVKLKSFIAHEGRTTPVRRFWDVAGMPKVTDAVPPKPSFATPAEEARYRESMIAFHAYSTRLVQQVKLPTKDRKGLLSFWRTESAPVMQINNINGPANGLQMPRGMLESTSMFAPISVYGDQVTRYAKVPPWRVFSTYLQSKRDGGVFHLGDDENEALVFLDGLPFDFIGKLAP